MQPVLWPLYTPRWQLPHVLPDQVPLMWLPPACRRQLPEMQLELVRCPQRPLLPSLWLYPRRRVGTAGGLVLPTQPCRHGHVPLQGMLLLDRRAQPLNPTACQELPQPRWEWLLLRRLPVVELYTRHRIRWLPSTSELDWKLKLVACGCLSSQMCWRGSRKQMLYHLPLLPAHLGQARMPHAQHRLGPTQQRPLRSGLAGGQQRSGSPIMKW